MGIKHPFSVLKPEYTKLLAAMKTTKVREVNDTARRLLRNKHLYEPVSNKTGIPMGFIAASFEREASSNFSRSPAQGDPWNKKSTHVPKGRGPFDSWEAAALDAYHLNGLDKVGAGNWTWELACFYGEIFNGLGYRDWHHMRSPYLWGGTNLQQPGKYVADGKFDAKHFDSQLGIIPVMRQMALIDSDFQIGDALPLVAETPSAIPNVTPAPAGVGGKTSNDGHRDMFWIQNALNMAGASPKLRVDGFYGRKTRQEIIDFQHANHLRVDGFAGPETIGALEKAIGGQDELVS